MGCPWLCASNTPAAVLTDVAPMHVDVLQLERGAVGMSRAPGRKKSKEWRDMEADVRWLRDHYQFDAVVTLIEEREMEEMQCCGLGAAVHAMSMQWIHV